MTDDGADMTGEIQDAVSAVVNAVDEIRQLEDDLIEFYAATDVDISSYNDSVIVTLEYREFESLEPALERVTEVARDLKEDADNVRVDVGTEGEFGVEPDEDEQPGGSVRARFS